MTLRDIIRELPDEALVPVGWVRPLVAETAASAGDDHELADLTAPDVARILERAPSTIRGWCASGAIEGAYRLRGREWRIPRDALRRYQDAERQQRRTGEPTQAFRRREVDLSSWRKLRT